MSTPEGSRSDIPDEARALLGAPVHAVLTTINPDGGPQTSVVWSTMDGGDVLFSTIRGRRKCRNLERDPRVSLLAYHPDDPYSYVEIRGSVTLDETGGDELIDRLSRAYTGNAWTARGDETRVVVRITPRKVIFRQAPQRTVKD